jgi:hypothetical protein
MREMRSPYKILFEKVGRRDYFENIYWGIIIK